MYNNLKRKYISKLLPTKMNAAFLLDIERRCRTMEFRTATRNMAIDCPDYLMLLSYPSKIIQSRIEFDHITSKKLIDLSPLQIMRVSALKRSLMEVLHNPES